MNDAFGLLAIVVPVVALIAITAALLRDLGPFDLMSLWYMPRETRWPTGVQEADPRPWDFAARPADPPQDPAGPAREG
jgi:hypothetical protein